MHVCNKYFGLMLKENNSKFHNIYNVSVHKESVVIKIKQGFLL